MGRDGDPIDDRMTMLSAYSQCCVLRERHMTLGCEPADALILIEYDVGQKGV
jgi:hypothetical protein